MDDLAKQAEHAANTVQTKGRIWTTLQNKQSMLQTEVNKERCLH